MIKAVMFDLDGTLLNTIDGISSLLNHALKQLGYPLHTLDEYKLLVGGGIEKLAYDSLPEDKRDKETLKKCLDIVFANYDEFYTNNTKVYPGIKDLLSELHKRGLKLAVLSNRPDHYTKQLVEKYFTEKPFEIVSGALPDVPCKPDPIAAFKMAELMSVKPEEIIYVGDTGIDMKTAKNAKMFGVGVLWGFRSKAELQENGADLIIGEPVELLSQV